MTNTQAQPQELLLKARKAEILDIEEARRSLNAHKAAYDNAAAHFTEVIGKAHTNGILDPQEVDQAGQISPTYRRRLEAKAGVRTPSRSQPATTAERKRTERQDARARRAQQS